MDQEERESKRSAYFRELQAKRKRPYLHFKDPEIAREAQLNSAKARSRNAKIKRQAKKNSQA